jgi:hypothetical protein
MSELPVRILKSQNKTVNVRSAARGGCTSATRHDLCVSRLYEMKEQDCKCHVGAARGARIGTCESYTKSLLGVSAVLRVDDWFKNANTLF